MSNLWHTKVAQGVKMLANGILQRSLRYDKEIACLHRMCQKIQTVFEKLWLPYYDNVARNKYDILWLKEL